MLAFFRKYQRYLYILVTIVIVVSFSFFGTYSTLGADNLRQQIAFRAVDGTDVTRAELEEMTLFIGTDNNDKKLYGGAWGPNFLNDGVIKTDFLATGLAETLIQAYLPDFKSDFDIRLRKERAFVPYANPSVKFVGAMTAWSYFSPEIAKNLKTVQGATDASSPDVLNAKIKLFLAQEQFPPSALYQVLRYQEGQYKWVTPDPNLNRADLFLFGYHNFDDWFGVRFTRLISQFIINAAKVAEQRGYVVTKDEAFADLLKRSEESFKENAKNPNLGVKNSSDYFLEQLRRMGMDQVHAVRVWQQVLLFRRLFQDLGNSMFVDPLVYNQFNAYALEMVEGTLYQLPAELRLGNFNALQKFETYLNAVSRRGTDEKSLLDLPKSYLSVDEVARRTPELVQKKYTLDVVAVDKKSLEARVGVKDAWNWEVEDANWKNLKKQYPELGLKKGDTKNERLNALDTLDSVSRAKIDQMARSAIVDAHPEWIGEALDQAEPQKLTLGLREKGGDFPFQGVSDRSAFLALLDQAPLQTLDPKLTTYPAENLGFYRIRVLERAPEREILTFAEAGRDGTLDELLNQQLEVAYVKMRSTSPDKFQNPDKSWRPLADVRDQVAEEQFVSVLNALRNYYAQIESGAKDKITSDRLAQVRLLPYVRSVLDQIQKDPTKAEENIRESSTPVALATQWQLLKSNTELTRGKDKNGDMRIDELLKMKQKTWSTVHTPANGDINFFYALKKGVKQDSAALAEQIADARALLSNDAQQMLMADLLRLFHAKKAISFDYLKPTEPSVEAQPES